MKPMNVLLAGQQNAGKSTLFNMLTGARQHVANYPGVTVDKKSGSLSHDGRTVRVTDLPGTYSLTCYSLEERVARGALLDEQTDAVINVVDAANLSRSLHLTLQLIEMEKPLMLVLNMMDVAEKAGWNIDSDAVSRNLGIPVIKSVGRKAQGTEAILSELDSVAKGKPDYGFPELDTSIKAIAKLLESEEISLDAPLNWLALRLLERDDQVWQQLSPELSPSVESLVSKAEEQLELPVRDYIVAQRHAYIQQLLQDCTQVSEPGKANSLSAKIDKVVLHPIGAPLCLLATVFAIYQASIVWGYELTNYTWPLLASLREWAASLLPAAGFLHDPYTRALGLWIVDSANTLLNYIPIFLILFALIAILEDSGYMARIAFIADRALNRFGLHGQSTLPMILSGVFAGGCAVPGIMATKGIPDNRARLATIMTVPFMNCLAKVPLYTLLVSTFFAEEKALMMFFISTITIIFALLVAKLLTQTVLKGTETAPFVMELPRYNLPTVRCVLTRAFERTWTYVKKVGTIVVAVSTVIFVLLQFPGLSQEAEQGYQVRAEKAVTKFERTLKKTEYTEQINRDNLTDLVNYYTDFKRAKLNASGAEGSKAVSEKFKARNNDYFTIVVPRSKEAKQLNRALRKLDSERKKLRREIKEQQLATSLLGRFGRALEPVTQYAGFDWKINVALFSSFAARESSVATLGVLFQPDEDSSEKLENRIGSASDFKQKGQLSAVALILFFALYPPCLATVMMIKVQTGQYRWMLLSMTLPTALGLGVASAVYTIGSAFAVSGIAAMGGVYALALALLLVIGLYKHKASQNMKTQPSAG